MCLCSCSWSACSSVWRGSCVLAGSRIAPSSSKREAIHSRAQRLLKPRCPDDCPSCRLASTPSAVVEPVPLPVRPWREVKSRRGARHSGGHRGVRLSMPAMLVLRHLRCSDPRAGRRWQAWPCRADPDLSRSCLPHHVQCSAPYPSLPFENPFTPDRSRADSAGRRTRPFRGGTSRRAFDKPRSRPGSRAQPGHAQTLHKYYFCNLQLPHLQLDELRTRLRRATQIRLSVAGHRSLHEPSSCA